MISSEQNIYKYLQFKDKSIYRRFIQGLDSNVANAENTTNKKQTNVPNHGSYGALLFHPKWKARRKEILDRDQHRCINCKSDKQLQIHHRQYHFILSQNRFRFPWDYPDYLLITLCESCHNKGHNLYTVPTITI